MCKIIYIIFTLTFTLRKGINQRKEVLMRSDLTTKQAALLDYLRRVMARDGKTPSLRQAAKELGISHAAVSQMIGTLEAKGFLRRDERYQRTLRLLNQVGEVEGTHRMREVPIIGSITAGVPLYAQEKWEGSLVVDTNMFRGQYLFGLYIKGDSMTGVGILDGDIVICEPRQYAKNGEIVVALINHSEATVKRFFLHGDYIELKPENSSYEPRKYELGEVLVQGKVVGVVRSPEIMERV